MARLNIINPAQRQRMRVHESKPVQQKPVPVQIDSAPYVRNAESVTPAPPLLSASESLRQNLDFEVPQSLPSQANLEPLLSSQASYYESFAQLNHEFQSFCSGEDHIHGCIINNHDQSLEPTLDALNPAFEKGSECLRTMANFRDELPNILRQTSAEMKSVIDDARETSRRVELAMSEEHQHRQFFSRYEFFILFVIFMCVLIRIFYLA